MNPPDATRERAGPGAHDGRDDVRRLLAALRLASPALPIGGFSYSQGLECAIERGWVRDEPSCRRWLLDLIELVVARFEAPLVLRIAQAVAAGDHGEARRLDARYLASRETAELRAETLQMGWSLARLLAPLPEAAAATAATIRAGTAAATLEARTATETIASTPPITAAPPVDGRRAEPTLPLSWAQAAHAFGLAPADALATYLWAWLENQVTAAIKAVPLGQQAGQRLLSGLAPALAEAIGRAAALGEDEWANAAPGLALASGWHETQYSRLFRS